MAELRAALRERRDSVVAWVGRIVVPMALVVATAVGAAPSDVSRGLTWLQSQVLSNGGLVGSLSHGAQQQAQCETATTLLKLAGASSQVSALVAALEARDNATETLACWQQLRQQAGQAVSPSEVAARRVVGQGYAAYEGFGAASALDTGRILAAQLRILTAQEKADLLGWLQSSQSADGSFAVSGRGELVVTSAVLRGLKDEASTNSVAASIAAKAASWILAKRSAQGHWLDDIATTALAFEAVHPYTATDPSIAATVESWLLAKQALDGSWQGDAYTSAVALRALVVAGVPALDPTRAALKVRFIDSRTGTPVPNVRLESANPPASALSDAAGVAQLSGQEPATYQFTATLAGYAPVSLSAKLVAGQQLDLGTIQLVPPPAAGTAVISGTVREQGTNIPIAGAIVRVDGQGVSATTADDGTYLVSNVAPGALTVNASRPGFFSSAASLTAVAGQVLNFSPWLSPDPSANGVIECKIVGTIVAAATQSPVAGVMVAVTGAATASAVTDAAGRYSIPNLTSGTITIAATMSGYDTVTTPALMACSYQRTTVLDFSPRLYATGQTPPGGNSAGISGVVIDAGTGQPIPGAQLQLTPSFGLPQSLSSGADGRFAFAGLAASSAQLQVQASGYAGVTFSHALTPLQTVDVGQVRLRRPKVEQFLADLRVDAVTRGTASTDAQTLQLTGAVQVEIANAGTQSTPSTVDLLAFSDLDRNGRFDASVDKALGQLTLGQSLLPGQTISLQISVAGVLPFRDAPITVVADPAEQLAEATRSNNARSTAESARVAPPPQPFRPTLKYFWKGLSSPDPNYKEVSMTPVVGPLHDTNGDGKIDSSDTPRVVFAAFSGTPWHSSMPSVLRAIDGATGADVWSVPLSTFGGVVHQTGMALADLDGDGAPEIVAIKNMGGLVVLNNMGQVKWQKEGPLPYSVAVADLDGDGKGEVLYSNKIYSHTGDLKLTLAECPVGASSYAVKLLPASSGQQIVCGNALFGGDGTFLWRAAVPDTEGAVMSDVSFDGGATPNFVLVYGGKVWRIDHLGRVVWGEVPIGSGWGGAPMMADLDGDGVPEIAVAGQGHYTVYRSDGTLLWQRGILDMSGAASSTAFDFDGDGLPDAVHRGQGVLHIFNGRTGNTIYSVLSSSSTGGESPVVADVDGDGHADLVVPGDFGNEAGIYVYSDLNRASTATRKVWNQFQYSRSNINDDLSLPRDPAPSWKTHNTFRVNGPIQGEGVIVPDATASYLRVADSGQAGSRLTVRIGNGGGLSIPAGLKVAFYAGTVGEPVLGIATTSRALAAGEFEDVHLDVTGSLGNRNLVTIVADDNGAGLRAINDFDRNNNTVLGELSAIAANLIPGVTTDKPLYTEAEQAVFTATVRNAGSFARDAAVRFSVVDAAGRVVDVLPVGASASVAAGSTHTGTGLWPVAGVLSGNYQVRAEALAPTGLIYGVATANFSVMASQTPAASVRIGSDRVSYTAAQTVQLTSRIVNTTANTALSNLQARTEVTAAGGQSVFAKAESIDQLAPAGTRQYSYSLAAQGLAAGSYVASLRLLDAAASTLAQSTASFTVLGADQTGVGLTGQVQATPAVVAIGQTSRLTLQAVNTSLTALASVPVAIRVIDPNGGGALATFNATFTDWTPGQPRELGFDWSAVGGDGQVLVVSATAQAGGREIALAQTSLRLIGVPRLKVEPEQLTFAPIYPGESALQGIVVTSVGSLSATSLTFSLGGADASQFALPAADPQGNCLASASLPIGATCTISVGYRPQSDGEHSADLRIGLAQADPLLVPLAGQSRAVLFTGTVATSASEVEAGANVNLSYSVSNPAGTTSTMAGSLSVTTAAGQSLAQWPIALAIGGGASYAVSQPFTTPLQPQNLWAVLSQTLGSESLVLATATFAVIDPEIPIGLTASARGQARMLVLVSCPTGPGAQDDAACVAARSQSIAAYLNGLGIANKVVSTRDAFLADLRCGTFNAYWISGGAIKLDEQTIGELRQAVYRGEALWMDGVHDSRNQLLHDAAGVKQLGKLPQSNLPASLAADGLYGAGTLSTLGQPTQFELTTGLAQGVFSQSPGQAAPVPAIVSNSYGAGRSLLFAFDLAGMIGADSAPGSTPLRSFVTTSSGYAASLPGALTIGDLTLLHASVSNLGSSTVALQLRSTLPPGLTSTWATPSPLLTANIDGSTTALWNVTLPAGASLDLLWQVRALQSGSYNMPLTAFTVPQGGTGGSAKLRNSSSWQFEVEDVQAMVAQPALATLALQPSHSADKNARNKALEAIAQAQALHAQGQYEGAIPQWLAAADALASIGSADTQAARAAVALALEASTDALCIQRCGSAACQ